MKDVVIGYAQDVVSGKEIAGKPVRLACEKFLRELEGIDGYVMDWERAEEAVSFVESLPHIKGEWASPTAGGAAQLLVLEPWQKFTVANIFGWRKLDGTRRFRIAMLEVARKNGKTTWAAAMALYSGFFENEPGAETYSVATTRDQARIAWDTANRMVNNSALKRYITAQKRSIFDIETGSKFEPLAAEASTLDGLHPHCVICDELHAHKTGEVWGKMETATGARRSPLIIVTTTAGFDRNTICFKIHDYCMKVLDGSVSDPTVFAYIATLDEGDDWTDERVWKKANPNLGVSAKLSDLRAKCEKAKAIPAEVQTFRRLHCNEWTESSARWLPMDRWNACRGVVVRSALKGKLCYGGLDLARARDLTSFYLYFPEENQVLGWNWIDDESIVERTQRDRVPYGAWRDNGHIEATPGNVTDFAFIKKRILEVCDEFDVREIGYDRFMATQLVTELSEEGVDMVPVGQGFVSMAAPTSELERLVVGGEIQHGGDPVLTWAASNAVVRMDPAGNKKVDKEKSTERVDPIIALVMAIGRAQVNAESTPYYEAEGELLAL